jgi:sulfite exporter TauE/SafE
VVYNCNSFPNINFNYSKIHNIDNKYITSKNVRSKEHGGYLRGNKVVTAIGKTMQKTGRARWLTIGVLNGFLPCGLVYVALAGALAIGTVWSVMWYIVLFGLGTFPLMYVLSIFRSFEGVSFRNKIKKIIPTATFIVGVLLILWGLNLGIPYVSPKVKESHLASKECAKTTMECCSIKSDTNMAR